MISTTTSSSSAPRSTLLVRSFAAAVSPYLILPEIMVCPTIISYLILHLTELLITVHLTSDGTLFAHRYPNSLDAYELRKSSTMYRRTYTEWRFLSRQESNPSARMLFALQHHPKPALRGFLWNGFRHTITAETMGAVPNPCSTHRFQGLMEVQTHEEEEAYNERSGEYESCFCGVTFLTRLQQFCGLAFPSTFWMMTGYPISCSTQSRHRIHSNFLASNQPSGSGQECESCYYATISG